MELSSFDGELYQGIASRHDCYVTIISYSTATFTMIFKCGIIALFGGAAVATATTYAVPSRPNSLGQPFEAFVSYSIELSSFPDFAGKLPDKHL